MGGNTRPEGEGKSRSRVGPRCAVGLGFVAGVRAAARVCGRVAENRPPWGGCWLEWGDGDAKVSVEANKAGNGRTLASSLSSTWRVLRGV